MKEPWFLLLLLFPFLLAVLGETLQGVPPEGDWLNSSPSDANPEPSLQNGWFKYNTGRWGRKFNYGRYSVPPVAQDPPLVRSNTSFHLLVYLTGYYLLGRFSNLLGRFSPLGQLGHLAMVTVPIVSVVVGLNLGALFHKVGRLLPAQWIPDSALL